MAKNWKEALCYSTPSYYEHKVNNQLQRFYPVSVGLLFKLRRTASNVIKAISDMFVSVASDSKRIDSTTTGRDVERTIVVEPITLEMAKYRDQQKSEAWSKIIESITDEETMSLLAEIIMDSMREVFAEGAPNPAEFLKETKLPTLVQMVVGVAKGNQDVFGPLASKVGSVLSNLEKAASSKLTEYTEAKAAVAAAAQPSPVV